jgi:DNA-binding PadR family transcriptional regulator
MVSHKPHYIGALSPEMALLGQLFGSPGYGYDLHRKVVSDLGHVWHLSQSQAYAILKRLEAQGDILMEETPQEKLPSRQILHLTQQGRERFLTWLDTPSGGSTRAIRLEFITRLYFLDQYFPEKIAHAFDQQRSEAKDHIQRLKETRDHLSDDQIYNCMSLDMRLEQLEAVLEWLDECQKNFQ